MENIGIYVHIPFCVKKCNYCDFLSFAIKEEDSYIAAVLREIDIFKSRLKKSYRVESIFFGGGTPSIISTSSMERIMYKLRSNFVFAKDIEISMELNPATFSKNKLKAYKKMGINRLSIGLQSTEDEILRLLGRAHTYKDFLIGYAFAREVGFSNINIDLMAGLPRQTLEKYIKSIYDIIKLKPEHISSYGLIIEEETPFFELYNEEGEKHHELPDEAITVDMYKYTKKILAEAGYNRYEISNYAKKGYACRHNLRYWKRKPYRGFGLGAASHIINKDEEIRFSNTRSFDGYLAGDYNLDIEELTKRDIFNEIIFLGLRLTSGIDLATVRQEYNIDLIKELRVELEKFKKEGLIYYNSDNIRLTEKGLELSNYVMMGLIRE